MAMNPGHLNQRISQRLFTLILVLTAILWIYSLFFVPTFDLDESLYRRVAEEIKRSGNWWQPTWDHLPLYHKPPIFYWMIALISRVVDGVQAPVSVFAARLPSFLASIGILVSLYRFTRNVFAPSLFLCAIFPMLTATGVIFEPIQTLFLLPTLVLPAAAFLEERTLTIEEHLYIGLGMFLSSAFKGLNGLVLPTFAFGLHWLFFLKKFDFKQWLKPIGRFTLYAFLPATVLLFLYYSVLDSEMGRAFTREFFLVHHLGRARDPMESHGGNVFYQPLVLFFGGGFLTPFLLYQWMRIRPDYRQYCFPLTYALAFLLVFTITATKLPHYIWPAWPALALMGAIFFELAGNLDGQQNERPIGRTAGFLASLPVFVLGALAIFTVFSPTFILNQIELSQQARIIVSYFTALSFFSRLSLVGAAILCIAFQSRRSYLTRHPMLTASFGVGVSVLLGFGILPTLNHLLVQPFDQIAQSVRERARPGDCIRYSGPHSPTLSIALGTELIHNRCEPNLMKYLITPQWKEHECQERGMKVVDQKEYLLLCVKEK